MSLFQAMFTGGFQPGWIMLVGVLAAVACAIPGNYLILRRMSMMGDAISHAVLPGIAIAFLLTASRGSVTMFIGAAVVGVLTAVFTEWIHRKGNVDSGAAMGVVFTTFFAIGLLLIRQAADHVDIDPECVLYGNIEMAALRDSMPIVGRIQIPLAVWTIGSVLLVNVIFVLLFWKELKISAFDPQLATAMGFNASFMHYALMGIVAVTTVAAFEAVGSIIVIAMLIVPGAAAHLLTDRLWSMMIVSVLFAIGCAVGGYYLAIEVPPWFGYSDTRVAGGIAVAAGIGFTLIMFFSPKRGLISQAIRRTRLSVRILQEDVLGLLYRLEELKLSDHANETPMMLQQALGAGPVYRSLALSGLVQKGRIRRTAEGYQLTDRGRTAASNLVRSHRLWETYLAKHLLAPDSHLHGTAELLEHVTDVELQKRLDAATNRPRVDPHGKAVPEEKA